MSDFTLDVIRASDLLVLRFSFVNLQLDTTAGQPPRLVRIRPAEKATFTVDLGPQHIAEEVFAADAAGQPVGVSALPVRSVLARPTRLAFQVPDNRPFIPLTLQELLAWHQYEPVVAANALPEPPGPHQQPGLTALRAGDTAIELPTGLVLSPDSSGAWIHSVAPVSSGGRVELWHTRLGVRGSTGPSESRLPAVRAVTTSLGLDFSDFFFGQPLFVTSLTRPHRTAIARASADFTGGRTPLPLTATHLMLSRLGGWTDVSGAWDELPALSPTLKGWRHVTAQGRDQYVRIVEQGVLYPFGHRASKVIVIERAFAPAPGADGSSAAFLGAQRRIVVQEPERTYSSAGPGAFPFAGREMPIETVHITTLSSPNLDESAATDDPFFPTAIGGRVVLFSVVATDKGGNQFEFAIPMLFAPEPAAGDPELLRTKYDEHPEHHRTELRGQSIAFASDPGGAATLHTWSLTFGTVVPGVALPAGHPPFLPTIDAADVTIPSVDDLPGVPAASATAVTFHSTYLGHAFDAGRNPGEVFLRMVRAKDLALPSTAVGGLATPSLKLEGMSRRLGPVPTVDKIAVAQFDPAAAFAGLEAKLLGAIDLKSLIKAVVGSSAASLDTQVPRLVQERTDATVTTSYRWRPEVMEINEPSVPLVTNASTVLDLEVKATVSLKSAPPPTTTIKGTLSNFALSLVGLVRVRFEQLAFQSLDGRKLELKAKGIAVEFENELKFVKTLAQVLPANGFGDGALIDIRPDGIRSGYSIGIPAAGIGAFSLENIALSAELFLPFTGAPASLRLSFSTREHPFLVTISMIGGGGFLSIVLETDKVQQFECALEVGGNITIGLVITSANVQVMAGFYFGIRTVDGVTTLDFKAYVRVSGSVEVLGIVGISIDIYVGLRYVPTPAPGVIRGEASLTIGVHLLMFSRSVTLSVGCAFDIDTGRLTFRSFEDTFQLPDWVDYCRAFA